MREDAHDHTQHTASPAGHGSLSQDVDLCETGDPNTASTMSRLKNYTLDIAPSDLLHNSVRSL